MSGDSNNPNIEARLRLAEKDVDRHERELRTVGQEAAAAKENAGAALRGVAKLSSVLEGLARQQSTGAEDAGGEDDQAEPIPCWLTINDPEQALHLLADLSQWITAIYGKYPDGNLKGCWQHHPNVVEELQALRNAWLSAYQGSRSSARAVMDWHNFDRPNTAKRITQSLSTCNCPPAKHSTR